MNRTEAWNNYQQAKQGYADVSRGGKDYHCCQFMDISVRSDRLKVAKQALIQVLGEEQLASIEENQ